VYLHGGHRRFGDVVVGDPTRPAAAVPPRPHRWVVNPGRLHFDAESRTWGGPMAFVDTAVTHERWAGKAWPVDESELRAVLRQENGVPEPLQIDLAALCVGDVGAVRRTDGTIPPTYGHVARVADVDGCPAYTITGAPGQRIGRAGRVRAALRAVMAAGLADCDVTDRCGHVDATAYLAAAMRHGAAPAT
jgi:hypothetical protein